MDIAGTSGHAAELTAGAGRYPLSANLELFCMFDKGDEQGALGPRHLMVTGWRWPSGGCSGSGGWTRCRRR